MNYKHQAFFPNNLFMWKARVQGLFNMNTIKSP